MLVIIRLQGFNTAPSTFPHPAGPLNYKGSSELFAQSIDILPPFYGLVAYFTLICLQRES